MPLVQNFTVTQVIGSPNNLTFTDTSTGSDVLVTGRRVYLQTAYGTYVVESTNTTTDYNTWLLVNTSQTFNVLNKDYALNGRVDWVDAGGAVLYTLPIKDIFTQNLEQFHYGLTKYQASNHSITQNTNYYNNKAKLWQYIVSAKNAMTLYGDVSGAQDELDAATNMITNEKSYF
jgi:hypothetical protein